MHRDLAIRLRVALFGAVAFVLACVAHEAVGHGGACVLTGGKIELLTSVYFRCRPGSSWVDAAGPIMNLLLAAIAWLMLRARVWSPAASAFIALLLGFNAMWGAGYMPYSALANLGDWAFIFTDHGALPNWALRALTAAIGVWLYSRSMRIISPHLPTGSLLITAYLAATAVGLTSVLLFSGPLMLAAREAFLESAIAPVGLLYIALFPSRNNQSSSALVANAPGHWFWPCAVGIVVAFLALMGPGYRAG